MLVLSAYITIDRWVFGFADVEITEDVADLADTCTITLPRKLRWADASVFRGPDAAIKKGQEVSVSLGYDRENVLVFRGYIRNIKVEDKAVLQCEDSTWLLKQANTQVPAKAWTNATVSDLLSYCMPAGISWEAQDIKVGSFRMNKKFTPAQLLSEICSTEYLNITAGFRLVNGAPKLFVGGATTKYAAIAQNLRFSFNFMAPDWCKLQYQTAEDRLIHVKAYSIQKDKTKLGPVTAGDPDGEERTVYQYDTNEASLQAFANEEYAKFKKDGYSGSFTYFGVPTAFKGDSIRITENPLGDGQPLRLIVKRNVRTFSTGGYRQEITIL